METMSDIVTISQQKEELLRNKIHEVNAIIVNDPDTAAKTALEKLAEILLSRFPVDVLGGLDGQNMFKFTKQRFNFIQESLGETVSVSVSPYTINGPADSGSTVILELLIEERPFIIDSLTEYLHDKQYQLSLMTYPVLSIDTSDQKEIRSIGYGTEETDTNFVYCCCVIDNVDQDRMPVLKNDVKGLLETVCCVTDDFGRITKAVEEYSVKDSENESESLMESERLRLFSWFNSGNVILLGAGELAKEDTTPELTWDKIQKPLGSVRRKKDLADPELPVEIGRLGSYFLESGLIINVIELPELSEVHRRDRIQLVFRKKKDAEGKVRVGFFHLLFTNKSRKEAAMAIPLARLKVNAILESVVEGEAVEGKRGHLFKVANDFFSVIPKSELFRIDRPELKAIFEQFRYFGDYQQTRVSTFAQPERRYARVTFCLPNHRFSQDVFTQIDNILTSILGHSSEIKYWFALGRNAYSHHIFFFPHGHPQLTEIDFNALEKQVASITIGWEESFQSELTSLPAEKRRAYSTRYANVFSSFYQAIFSPLDALKDIEFLESLFESDREQVDLRVETGQGESIIYVFSKKKYQLTEIMPHLQNLSLVVIDENTYELTINSEQIYIYTYYVRSLEEQLIAYENFYQDFCELLLAVFEKRTEDDILNGLILSAGLSKDEINLFILYRNYYWQIGAPYLPINKCFLDNASVIKSVRDFFVAKFNPSNGNQPLAENQLNAHRDQVLKEIETVKTVAEDIVFKTIFNSMEATIRTNYFNVDDKSALAVKIRSAEVERLPAPKPLFEIYIHGTELEGIHLRGAMIARGGLRHSDRHGDFRTEVLGLMNTQMLKNVVIVPEGSKGGFITKRRPSDRKEMTAEVEKQYRRYINSLLSLTDNIVDGQVIPANNIVRYDGDDPYLVVAADKGTAALSDVANEISQERGFWLEDAFASGGMHGYDHKKMAITAKGAWECVKLHFLEEGKDIQSTEFSVIGIGDMSGDVFGNGMLLSKFIRLKGAFNHIHIFIDPEPESAASWNERERLFNTPGTTWMDYDKSLISQGGGVFERSAKTIELSPEMKKMLGVSQESASGEELIQLLLKCEADLLWNGGIGTYVKASFQTAQQVGDTANDAVRVDAKQLRVKVVGEGGNLGLTQAARIEAAMKSIKLNTDAIDNSGGVDTSDHEVNMKILMRSLINDKQLASEEARNVLLEDLTNEVADLVLEDNKNQGQILSIASARSKRDMKPFKDLITLLRDQGIMDPKTDGVSSFDKLDVCAELGIGIPKPDLALLLSFTKMYFYKKIVVSKCLDDPYLKDTYYNYFPSAFKKDFDITKFEHPLRKEIIGTVLVNKTINQAGITLLPRTMSILEADPVNIIIAYTVIDEIFGFTDLRQRIMEELRIKNLNSAYTLLINIERFIRSVLIWMLIRFDSDELSFSMIEEFRAPVQEISGVFERMMEPDEKRELQNTKQNLMSQGISTELAGELSRTFMMSSLEIIVLAKRSNISLESVIELSQGIESFFHFRTLQNRIVRLKTDSTWSKKHKGLLMKQLQFLKQKVTDLLLNDYKDLSDIEDKLQQFLVNNQNVIKNYQTDYQQLISSELIELSGATILLDKVSGMFLD